MGPWSNGVFTNGRACCNPAAIPLCFIAMTDGRVHGLDQDLVVEGLA
jgi:hypothetical protein